MRSLYWKIFLVLWLVMALVIGVNITTTWLLTRHFESSTQSSEHISSYAFEAIDIYQREGLTGFKRWRTALFRDNGLRVLLIDNHGQSLSGEPLPPRLSMQQRNDMHSPAFRRHRPIIWPVRDNQGREYRFVILNPQQLSDRLVARPLLVWHLGISFSLLALISLLFSHRLLTPIRALQQASHALANGTLSTRVSPRLNNRRDELGQLGLDFDHMALRLESLVQGQQQMLRDLSHELRTPLARQRIALELARRHSDDQASLDRIEREAEKIDALIDEILQLARMNTDAQTFEQEPVDLCALVRALVEDANLDQHRVTLEAPPQLTCTLNRTQIARAVENIISNALKYSPAVVDVRINMVGGQACVDIEDRGPGIPEAMLKKVFEPFVRTDAARSREQGGWGLGLAIAAKAIQLHGGRLEAINRDGGGLRVTLTLPVTA